VKEIAGAHPIGKRAAEIWLRCILTGQLKSYHERGKKKDNFRRTKHFLLSISIALANSVPLKSTK